MTDSRPIVIALGGNAISPVGREGTIEEQFAQTRESASILADLIDAGEHVVVTHGNGPQVGNAIRRVELSRHEVYRLPLDICVADLQGGMGYMIAQCLNNELQARGNDQRVATVVTTIEVDPDDPAFQDPTKPIGPYYDADRAARYREEAGWDMVEIPGQGYRRVVPSPVPQRIIEVALLRQLAAQGQPLIAAGGGGIPVCRNGSSAITGTEAVIDKDLASALLAREIGARTLIIVTGVPRVAIDFGTPQQRDVDVIDVAEARELLEAGQFPPGSMGPKIRAAIDFVEHGPADARVVITDIPGIAGALAGTAGTEIRRSV